MHQRTLLIFTGISLCIAMSGCAPTTQEIVLTHPASSATVSAMSVTSAAGASSASSKAAPTRIRITVPFQSQAPLKNWDPLHEESCEEASLILGKHYLDGTDVSAQQMENEIQDLIAWETAHGYKWDVTTAELQKIAKDKYGMNLRMMDPVSAASLEHELSLGHPVIIPAAGRQLGNPHFTGAGPWYHMLVAIGYDRNTFITNDVGTRLGAGYAYDKNVLINAIHDWTGKNEDIGNGAKRALVVE